LTSPSLGARLGTAMGDRFIILSPFVFLII
jgi:hypothetical protein